MILVNGQWQGSADHRVYAAADSIAGQYLHLSAYSRMVIDTSDASLEMKHGIIGYDAIREQTGNVLALLRKEKPARLFTIGGGCDADVGSILYMNEFYNGDLTVLWFDAHGDINAPEESKTHLFYGMPARAILGECGESFPAAGRWLQKEQLINVGSRDLDPAEISYMKSRKIQRIPADMSDLSETLMNTIAHTGKTHVYIHFDLDVLEPSEFSAVPLPVPHGIDIQKAMKTLNTIRENCDAAGFGLFEYLPEKDEDRMIRNFTDYGLSIQ